MVGVWAQRPGSPGWEPCWQGTPAPPAPQTNPVIPDSAASQPQAPAPLHLQPHDDMPVGVAAWTRLVQLPWSDVPITVAQHRPLLISVPREQTFSPCSGPTGLSSSSLLGTGFLGASGRPGLVASGSVTLGPMSDLAESVGATRSVYGPLCSCPPSQPCWCHVAACPQLAPTPCRPPRPPTAPQVAHGIVALSF